MLQQTLDDFRLTRGEKSALSRILEHIDPTDEMLALYRSIAFELAREAIGSSGANVAGDVVEWLEDVAKVLQSHSGGSKKQHLAEAYFTPDDDCVGRIRGFLKSAKQTADICVFTITDDRVSDVILATHKRGITVRIVTDDDKAYDPGSDVNRLKRQGIPVRVDISQFHMHHKFAIVDGKKLLSGSYNWTRTASKENEENFLITDDPRLVGKYQREFETLWEKFA